MVGRNPNRENPMPLTIRPARAEELDVVLSIERAAFGEEDEAELVRALLEDPTARPTVSLLAFAGERAVGHVLFTAARIDGAPSVAATLLAPLAVVTDVQGQGIGAALARTGLEAAADAGAEIAFVLGHPSYYPRVGFEPAGRHGLDAPYPIPEKDADAWMVQELRLGLLGQIRGRVVPAASFMRPEYWRE